tara:strand:+ start:6909 stop:7826 length:918 start_codon:yes stop_codon:yes gene_type:complete
MTQEELNKKQNRNLKRKEKRKKKKEKSGNDEFYDVISQRMETIRKKIKEDYDTSTKQKQRLSEKTLRKCIDILLHLNVADIGFYPECNSIYNSQFMKNDTTLNSDEIEEMSKELDENTFIIDKENIYIVVVKGKKTIIKHSTEKKVLFYSVKKELLISQDIDKNLENLQTIWCDTKSFGRGMKRKLCKYLDVPFDSAYGMLNFINDLEIYKKVKKIDVPLIEKENKTHNDINLQYNIDEAFEKFKISVEVHEEGFIGYNELSRFRPENQKFKFNELISSFYGDKIIRGHRIKSVRGFKGIKFKTS